MRRRPESYYYEPVRKFLELKMGCVTESVLKNGGALRFTGRGWGRQIIDVYGIKGVKGNAARHLEGVAVEVKPSRSRTSLRNLLQASQYARLAHRCYLAQPREFDARTMAEAAALGIGLLRITSTKIIAVSHSRPFIPDPDIFEVFLYKSLRIVRCSICACHVFRYRKAEQNINARGHWVLDQFSPSTRNNKFNKKMYVCRKCEEIVSGISEDKALAQSVKRIRNEIRTLRSTIRKIQNH